MEKNQSLKPLIIINLNRLFPFFPVVAAFAVETLRQLILRDVEEDSWSHDSDDTPTNETAAERSSFTETQRPESLETVLSYCTDEWDAEPDELLPAKTEKPSVQVVRKGN